MFFLFIFASPQGRLPHELSADGRLPCSRGCALQGDEHEGFFVEVAPSDPPLRVSTLLPFLFLHRVN